MEIKKMLEEIKNKGITLKFISKLSQIPQSTIYKYSIGVSKPPKERKERLENVLLFLLNV